MRCQYIGAAHLLKTTAAAYIVKLLIQHHPVYKRFWLIAIVDWAFKKLVAAVLVTPLFVNSIPVPWPPLTLPIFFRL